MQPTAPGERIQLLDVLRGMAILGMFTVNMTLDLDRSTPLQAADLSLLDFGVLVFVDLFTNGKFITNFSLLYGIGFYLQLERANRLGQPLAPTYLRRSAGLLLIGVTAMALTAGAWILVDYAVLGSALLLFRRFRPRTILLLALTLLLAQKLGNLIPAYQEHLERTALAAAQGVPVAQVEMPEDPTALQRTLARSDAFDHGSFVEIARISLAALWRAFTSWRYYLDNLDILAVMLLGLYIGKRGLLRDAAELGRFAGRVLPWLLGIGLGGCLVTVLNRDFGLGQMDDWSWYLVRSLTYWPLGAVSLGLAYAAIVARLMQRPAWQHRLQPFAAVGRFALSNYLVTQFVGAAVILPWGLGLYDDLTLSLGLFICLAAFALQIPASNWWLGRFRFGPCEWLWRSMTYGRLPPVLSPP